MSDEFYVPDASALAPQSADNKQGRNGSLDAADAEGVQSIMRMVFDDAYGAYETLINPAGEGPEDSDYADGLSEDFPGVAREIGRNVLPVSNYTEVYWKQNLHNFFHLVKLRTDPHAQLEIRQFAQAAYDLVRPHFPAACEAFDDYVIQAKTFSRMEHQLLMDLLAPELLSRLPLKPDGDFLAHYGLTAREFGEFKAKLGLNA
jgi:thymidylate synthase (FAD)